MKIGKIIRTSWKLAKTNLKLKYEGSYLGPLWYILKPLLLLGVLLIVFSSSLGRNIIHYPVYLLLGIIIWNLLSEATLTGMESIKNSLIKSIKFPKESLVVSSIISSIISHVFEILVFALFLLIYGISPLNLIFYVFILVFFFFFVLGVSFFLSSVNIYFSDLRNIWIFALLAGWFLTPIFYLIREGSRLFTINLFNPMFYFISIAREIVIYKQIPELFMFLMIILFSLSSLLIGYLVFKRLENKFPELI